MDSVQKRLGSGRQSKQTDREGGLIHHGLVSPMLRAPGTAAAIFEASSDLWVDIQEEALLSTNNDIFKQELLVHVAWCLQAKIPIIAPYSVASAC